MKLSKVDRLVLANQYQLLSMEENNYISKERAQKYSTILLEGYELLYHDIFSSMDEIVSYGQCEFVQEVLSMYRIISNSYLNLSKESSSLSLTERDIAFKGFDANNDPQYSFAKFLIKDYDRFGELSENEYMTYNSHSSQSIFIYQEQLERYNKIIDEKKEINKMDYLDLTEKEIKIILDI